MITSIPQFNKCKKISEKKRKTNEPAAENRTKIQRVESNTKYPYI